MTENAFRDSWGKLARAVLERAFADLDPTAISGFSSCSPSARKRWRKDTIQFFEHKRYGIFAESAGFTVEDISKAYKVRSKCKEENREI